MVAGSITCNNLISHCCKKGHMEVAFRPREEMVRKIIFQDPDTDDSLIGGLCKAGLIQDANRSLKEMLDSSLFPSHTIFIMHLQER
jgi:pentatricopeptide repeat protein